MNTSNVILVAEEKPMSPQTMYGTVEQATRGQLKQDIYNVPERRCALHSSF